MSEIKESENKIIEQVLKFTAISAATAVAGFLLGKGLKEKNNETGDLTFMDLDDEDFDEEADGEDWLFKEEYPKQGISLLLLKGECHG